MTPGRHRGDVDHPVLILVGQHGEAKGFELGMAHDECSEGFGLDIDRCLHLYRNDPIVPLSQKVYLYRGVVHA